MDPKVGTVHTIAPKIQHWMGRPKGTIDGKESHQAEELDPNLEAREIGQIDGWQASKYQGVRLNHKIQPQQNLAEVNEELKQGKVSRKREKIE